MAELESFACSGTESDLNCLRQTGTAMSIK